MPSKKTSIYKILFRNFLRRVENLFFYLKSVLSERHFLYVSCVAVAVSCAFAVIILKSFAHTVFKVATHINNYLKLPYINSILPIIGIVLTVFVIKNFLGGKLEKGSSRILYAVAKKGGILPQKQMYAQIITSSLTVGLGGSAGLESPITITGAAFGSNFAQKYHLSQKDRILLLACGVAAGIGAAFHAPIAGVLFAIEIVIADVSITAFIPIILAAATGSLISTIFLNEGILLSFSQHQKFDYHNVIYYVLLGILAGFASVYHARNFRRLERFFSHFKNQTYKRAIFGASILALLIFFFPTLFGEGYESIKTLSSNRAPLLLKNTLLERFSGNEWVVLLFIGWSLLLKVFATGLTLGSGGNGGNFAPSLFVGAYLGFFMSKAINLTGWFTQLPIENFTIVGMAGILSGLFHAPLTAIFLIGEITGGYNLMVPLMIVSSISFAISKRFEEHSMDVKHLADKGDAYTTDKDKNILSSIEMYKLVQINLTCLEVDSTLETVIENLKGTHQTFFPVINNNHQLVGVVFFDAIRNVVFNSFLLKHKKFSEIISPVTLSMELEDGIEKAIELLEKNQLEFIFVKRDGIFMGVLYKLDILEAYREKLKAMIIE